MSRSGCVRKNWTERRHRATAEWSTEKRAQHHTRGERGSGDLSWGTRDQKGPLGLLNERLKTTSSPSIAPPSTTYINSVCRVWRISFTRRPRRTSHLPPHIARPAPSARHVQAHHAARDREGMARRTGKHLACHGRARTHAVSACHACARARARARACACVHDGMRVLYGIGSSCEDGEGGGARTL